MKNHHHNHPIHPQPAAEAVPLHEAIAARARDLWQAQGCPENCDTAIWLEAEALLIAMPCAPPCELALATDVELRATPSGQRAGKKKTRAK